VSRTVNEAKRKAVIAANMSRFHAAQSAMPWHGRTAHASLDTEWELVEDMWRHQDPGAYTATNNWCDNTVSLPKGNLA
jgi:hypothetical protein